MMMKNLKARALIYGPRKDKSDNSFRCDDPDYGERLSLNFAVTKRLFRE